MNRKISVCMTTYNGEKYIEEQVDSILNQLCENDELIVCDDVSIDRTLTIIEGMNDIRIKIIRNNENVGVVKNFEKAIDLANGDFIFLADQDDIWEYNKIECFMNEFHDSGLLVSDAFIIDSEGKLIRDSFFNNSNPVKGLLHNIYKNPYLGCCMAFRAELKKYILPFPEKIAMHDIWIGNIVYKYGKIKFVNEKLLRYRRHGNNISHTGERRKIRYFTSCVIE